MALNAWTVKSGQSFGIFQERIKFDQALPVNNIDSITYAVISGKLPPGLRIQGDRIIGTPYEVSRATEFSFCIRASTSGQLSDRTFNITIEGANAPEFITPASDLNIGPNQQYYTLDSSYIDYQIEVFDRDTATGQRLSYFIASQDGELPPGLVLTDDGRIVGFVQPILSIKPTDGTSAYDNGYFDGVAYDFAYRPTNGFDSYVYDTVFYDFSLAASPVRKINRNYEFTVTVTDGNSIAKRTFKIFVVGDDYFRADNTTWLNGSGLFTADTSYLRAPIWLTRSNLGLYRANNYITLILDVYDSEQIVYSIDDVNNLPPGTTFDLATGEVIGRVPFQPAVTKTYTFQVTATRFGSNTDRAESTRTFTITLVGEIDSVINWKTPSKLGLISANFTSTFNVLATSTVPNATVLYRVISGQLPAGLLLDLSGEIIGKVNQYGTAENPGLTRFYDQLTTKQFITFDASTTTIDRVFNFTVQARDQYGYSASDREFTITVNTPNEITFSNIKTKPFLKLNQRNEWKSFINNTAIFTPASVYRQNDQNFGVQVNLEMLIYAGIQTTESAAYVGAMGLNHKKKRFQFGAVKKAIASTPGTTDQIYEVIYVEMVDPLEPNGKKLPAKLRNLSLQPQVITVDNNTDIWQPGFKISSPITADEQTKIAKLGVQSPTLDRPVPIISVDSTGYQISNSNVSTYFPSSISNWRERIKEVGVTERNYLPLWMRSIQPNEKQELGFTLAIPLCFCKIGTSDDIMLNIKFSGFDFKTLDYTADRYIIDSVEGYGSDKYFIFRNDRITI